MLAMTGYCCSISTRRRFLPGATGILVGLLLGLVGLSGCSSWNGHREPSPPWGNLRPGAEQIVAYLDGNARRIQSLRVEDLDITVQSGNQRFGASGMLAYQKPRNFRLIAYAGLQDQADIGSNDREFWFWFRQDKNNALYRCSYEDLPQVRSLRIPVHPDWLAQALCVQEIGPANQYRVQESGDFVYLTGQITSPQGQPLVKTLKIAIRGAQTGRIVSMSLRTLAGAEVWSADINEYHHQLNGYVVPRKIQLRCPSEKLEVALKLDRVQVNVLPPGNTGDMFVRPPKPGVQEIDLARGPAATPTGWHRGGS